MRNTAETSRGASVRRGRVVAGILCAWGATVAVAQQGIAPPDAAQPIPQWVCILLFAALVIAIALKNPKRTHKS